MREQIILQVTRDLIAEGLEPTLENIKARLPALDLFDDLAESDVESALAALGFEFKSESEPVNGYDPHAPAPQPEPQEIDLVHEAFLADDALHSARAEFMEAQRDYARTQGILSQAITAFQSNTMTAHENVQEYLRAQVEERRLRAQGLVPDRRTARQQQVDRTNQGMHDTKIGKRADSYMDRAGRYRGGADDHARKNFQGYGGLGGYHRGAFPPSMQGQNLGMTAEQLRVKRAMEFARKRGV